MAGTHLVERDRAILVLVDVQSRLADVMERRDAVVASSVLLARTCRMLGVPVAITRQYPRGLGDTVPELLEATAGIEPVDKVTFSCVGEPAFVSLLAHTGRRQVILAGMETHICVTQTALGLLAEGYDVQVVADATCSRRESDHLIALDRLRCAGVVVTTSESVIYEALGRAGTEEFGAVLEEVKARDAG
ncbi:MAG: hydrolase [Coriobacteriia bacterium]|nr:hydrolase [Coriobacteriia bacterium]